MPICDFSKYPSHLSIPNVDDPDKLVSFKVNLLYTFSGICSPCDFPVKYTMPGTGSFVFHFTNSSFDVITICELLLVLWPLLGPWGDSKHGRQNQKEYTY